MYSNQQQRTHTVLPREEEVHAYLLHQLSQVRRIAGTRPASITLVADTFNKGEPRMRWGAYIEDVPADATEHSSADEALHGIAERSATYEIRLRIDALRAKADELERGLQS
jgi:hypothetical protein